MSIRPKTSVRQVAISSALSNSPLVVAIRRSPHLLCVDLLRFVRRPRLPSFSLCFFGLDRRTFDAAHIVRAVMEGTILNLGYGFARMRALGLKPSEIRATGGGAKSRLWLQIAADVFGTPVVTLRETEAAAYGAALQSVWNWRLAKGEKTDIAAIAAKWVAKDKLAAEPGPKSAALYADLQARFNDLWRRLVPDFEARRKSL